MIITRIKPHAANLDESVFNSWPFDLPPVRQLMEQGLAFTRPVTFVVGENGSGKSTIIEAVAEAYGLDVRGGHGGRKYASSASRGTLGNLLSLELTMLGLQMRRRNSPGFFLRSETALGVFEFMSSVGVSGYGNRHLGEVSHGEGYLQVFEGRFNEPGLYLLDEPEAGLSFTSCLRLIHTLQDLASKGGQVICSTHSPLLVATPGAAILELSPSGITNTTWDKLQLVDDWRRFMEKPRSYL